MLSSETSGRGSILSCSHKLAGLKIHTHTHTHTHMHLSSNRRMEQQSECGFHGPAHQPYRDVGRVELDDPTLILDGLDQKQDNQVFKHH